MRKRSWTEFCAELRRQRVESLKHKQKRRLAVGTLETGEPLVSAWADGVNRLVLQVGNLWNAWTRFWDQLRRRADSLRRKAERRLLLENLEPRKLLTTATVSVNPTIAHAGDMAYLNVAISHPLPTPATVDYTIASGTAVLGTDFFLAPTGKITFQPGQTVSESTEVFTYPDAGPLTTRSFTVSLSNPTGGLTLGERTAPAWIIEPPAESGNTGSLGNMGNHHHPTPQDNTPAQVTVSLSYTNSSTLIEGQVANLSLALSQACTSAVTVYYQTLDGSISAPTGYASASSGSVTIPPTGQTTYSITVQTYDPGCDEGYNPYFLVELQGASDSGGDEFKADDMVPVYLQSPNATANVGISGPTTCIEGEATSLELTLSTPLNYDVTVHYQVGGSAQSGVNYQSPPGTATITAGSTTGWIAVQTWDTGYLSGSPGVSIQLTDAENADGSVGLSSYSTAGFTLLDSESPPSVSINGPSSVVEGDSVEFQITVSHSVDSEVSVSFTVGGGTATAGTDYTPPSYPWAVISAGNASTSITVATIDHRYESDQPYFCVSLGSAFDARGSVPISSASAASVYLVDSETPPSVGISAPSWVVENTDVSVQLTLSQSVDSDVSAHYTLSGTAAPGWDYTPPGSGWAVISAENTSAWITMPTVDHGYDGNQPYLCVALDSAYDARGNVPISAPSAASVYLVDSESPPTVAISGPGLVVEPDDASVLLTVSHSVDSDLSLHYTIGGTASAGVNYTPPASDWAVISAGSSSAWIAVGTIDNGDEANEPYLCLELDSAFDARGNVPLSADNTASVSLLSSEAALSVSIGDAGAITEGNQASFAVTLCRAVTSDVSVHYQTASGSSDGGTNYVPSDDWVTIPAGQTSGWIYVNTIDQGGNLPGGAYFTVHLLGAVGPQGAMPSPSASVGSAFLQPSGSAPTLSVTRPDSVTEGQPVQLDLRLSWPVGTDTSVYYQTFNGSATAGVNFQGVSGYAVIPAGQTSTSVSVDTIDEGSNLPLDAYFSVDFYGGSVAPDQSVASVSLALSHSPPRTAVTGAVTVTEGNAATLDVALSWPCDSAVVIYYHCTLGHRLRRAERTN